jgi:hypothetical protein
VEGWARRGCPKQRISCLLAPMQALTANHTASLTQLSAFDQAGARRPCTLNCCIITAQNVRCRPNGKASGSLISSSNAKEPPPSYGILWRRPAQTHLFIDITLHEVLRASPLLMPATTAPLPPSSPAHSKARLRRRGSRACINSSPGMQSSLKSRPMAHHTIGCCCHR